LNNSRTAILYFALRPKVEAKRKPIFPEHGRDANERFYRLMQEELFNKIVPLGIPMIEMDERHQQGKRFGDRITHAIQHVWSQGFDQVIILGNDCPEVGTKTIQESIELLAAGCPSLMRTHRGGAGLIAIRKQDFRAELWPEMEWQTPHTFDELFDCLAGCKVIGDQLSEINTLSDAYAYLELRLDDELSYFIDTLLNPLRHFVSLQSTEAERSREEPTKRRGPPSC